MPSNRQLTGQFGGRKRSEEELRKAHLELEIRVQERTAELVKANEALQAEIAERKRVEEALRESEDRYRDLVEHSQDLICTHDLEGRILSANPAAATLLGYGPNDYEQRNIRDILAPEFRDEFNEYLARIQRDGAASGLMVVQTRTGERRIWEYNNSLRTEGVASPIVRGMAHDVTDRKRAEVALRQSEQRFAKAFEASPLALTITSLKTGRLLEVNETFVRLSGYTREEAVGRTTLELGLWAKPTDREEELATVEERGQVRNIEYRFRAKDGTELVGLLSAERLEIGGEPCALTVIEDITDRKRAEAERAELLRREQEARKAAEAANQIKDEFLATLSHELRTPLNAIIGWSDMLSRKKVDPSLIAHAIDVINRNARSQAQLIEDLLDVSRIITGNLRLEVRPVEILPVVDAAMDVVRPAAEAKGIRLERDYDQSVREVMADPTRLQQVVWNLLSNATKFTPRGGRVEVRVRRVDSTAEITVSDTGQGIRPEFLPYIFDRFSQADSSRTRSQSGLGLGLAIVRYLVELHGGTVEASSEGEGRGATFIVNLPLAAITAKCDYFEGSQRRAEVNTSNSPELSGLRVLLVDDDADTREMLAAILTGDGAEVLTSATAREGFEALKGWRPDILVSDIGMPGEDGYSLIGKVRSLGPEEGRRIPAIALTGYASHEESERALRAGYQMHMAKPAEPSKLISVIAELMGRGGKGERDE